MSDRLFRQAGMDLDEGGRPAASDAAPAYPVLVRWREPARRSRSWPAR